MTNRTHWSDQLERPLALVFGGGASLGAIQVGMLRAVMEQGIRPDFMVGTSVGALNAGLMAQDFSIAQLERLETIWRGVRQSDVFPGVNWLSLARMAVGNRRHLASNKGLRSLADTHLSPTHAELQIPTTVVGSDVLTGEKVMFSEGNLREHVVISSSIPIIFEPVEYDGRTLVDGGVVSNVPVLPARKLGAESMIVLDPGYPCALTEVPKDLLGFSLHLIITMMRHQSYGVLHFLAQDSQIVYVPPPCPLDVAPHDFSRTEELLATAHRSSLDFLEPLELDGPGVYGHPHFHDRPLLI
ncbi:MAG: patatin-like phospholipase family protein [Persicimonas sp.]